MKCRTCGRDTVGSMNFCYKCLNDWSTMRKQSWVFIEKKLGKLSSENLKSYQKEMKKLEKVWRKDKNKFQEILKGGEKDGTSGRYEKDQGCRT